MQDPANAALERRVVLYVEDHPVNVLLMQALFAQRPQYELVVATTGEAGYAAALAHRPALLLLDLRLPDCHGTELLHRLRSVPELRGVPAVAVTADHAADARWAGFGAVWYKPLDVPATLANIDQLLAAAAPLTGEAAGVPLAIDAAGVPLASEAAFPGAGTAVAGTPAWPVPGLPRAVPGPVPLSSHSED